jgi:hypothetical protein
MHIDVDVTAAASSGDVAVNGGYKDKWQCVRSARVFSPNDGDGSGIHRFTVTVVESPPTVNNWRFLVGVVATTFVPATSTAHWVGARNSWGFAAGTGGTVNGGEKRAYSQVGSVNSLTHSCIYSLLALPLYACYQTIVHPITNSLFPFFLPY